MPREIPGERSTCPTCGAVVVVHIADEGTSHMTAASSSDLLRAQAERDEARAQAEALAEALASVLRDDATVADSLQGAITLRAFRESKESG